MSKTCGECRYFDERYNLCAVTSDFCTVDTGDSACDDFEQKPKPTNGDVIRQMNNEGIAAVMCGLLNSRDEGVFEAILNYLNAPADCVKQTGNDDTQADLCKVDNTESEGKDE